MKTVHWFFVSVLCVVINNATAQTLPAFADLIEQNAPAVVHISTHTNPEDNLKEPKNGDKPPPEWEKLFRDFFGNKPPIFRSNAMGSGFIIASDGYIVTNNHVVANTSTITVHLNDRRQLNAEVVGSDERTDLALIKVDANNLPVATIGSADVLRIGEWVFAIGSPFGFEHSVTAGIISAKQRSLPNENYVPFLQTDVAINPGNSGGPLFNMHGEVVGVNSQIFSRTGAYMGLSFAIPSELMQNVIVQLRESGSVTRGWLGVMIQDVNMTLAESFGLQKPEGALVSKVLPNSPAEVAQFKVGDVILRFNGETVIHSSALPPMVGVTAPNTEVEVAILRKGKQHTLTVTIQALPDPTQLAQVLKGHHKESIATNRLGIETEALSDDLRKEHQLEHGVVISKVHSTVARAAGLDVGDVILMLNTEEVKDMAHFEQLVALLTPGEAVSILIQRGNSPRFIAFRIPKHDS